MDAVPFAAGKVADELLLIAPLEVEPAAVGPCVDLRFADFERLVTAGDLLVDRLVRSESVAGLIDIGQIDRVADGQLSVGRLLRAGDHVEQCRLAGPVGTDDADNAAGRKIEVEVLKQQPVAERLAQPFRTNDEITERLGDGDLNIGPLLARVVLLRRQFADAAQPRLILRRTGLWATASTTPVPA